MTPALLIIAIAAVAIVVFLSRGARRAAPGVRLLSAAEARAFAADASTTVLDVRSEREFAGGRLAGARNIPLAEIDARIGELAPLKDRPVLVYCLSGGRSAAACGILAKNGFTQLADLQGGIRSWTAAGFNLER